MDQSQLKYARTHEWVALEGDVATIGITDFAVHLLSDLVYVDLPKAGRVIQVGQTFGEVESVKAVSDLYAPVSGEVIEVNAGLPDKLEALTADPFGAGWMVKVRLSNSAELGQLMDHATYQAHCEAEGH
ncbi:glycine cleavage system protein GcvH [Planctellipticum variicoloris]|uniref:glycine cleavage system protein GcvH n=1 Tax=Planctellipticum variicoloris TaxID=3064265 RepID=UPI003013D42F|nr:glycine cleavage system protein GcvH [Planctomycetaceae bacterium SH412]